MAPRTPKSPAYSDIDLANWKDYPDILTDSLWQFPSRKNTGTHVGDYHGNFIPQVADQIMTRYSKHGDVVLDMFLGMGTSLIECRRLGRHGIGIELLPEIAERSQARIEATENPHDMRTIVVNGSSADPETHDRVREALASLDRPEADLIFLHPPYSDIIRFSNGEHAEDLSTVTSDEEFVARFGTVAAASFDLLAPGRFMALVIGDKYAKGEWVPLGFQCMQQCTDAGYTLKSIVVKDINGNERGKGKNANLWKYRALKDGYYVFKHEYVMLFQKPQTKAKPRR
jgi:DNA modification methylase